MHDLDVFDHSQSIGALNKIPDDERNLFFLSIPCTSYGQKLRFGLEATVPVIRSGSRATSQSRGDSTESAGRSNTSVRRPAAEKSHFRNFIRPVVCCVPTVTSIFNGPLWPAGSTVADQTFSAERVDAARPSKVISVDPTRTYHVTRPGQRFLSQQSHIRETRMDGSGSGSSQRTCGRSK